MNTARKRKKTKSFTPSKRSEGGNDYEYFSIIFSYGDSKLAQGREAVKNLLTDNVELCDEIEAKIREVIRNVQD